jgi:hypothetical protein
MTRLFHFFPPVWYNHGKGLPLLEGDGLRKPEKGDAHLFGEKVRVTFFHTRRAQLIPLKPCATPREIYFTSEAHKFGLNVFSRAGTHVGIRIFPASHAVSPAAAVIRRSSPGVDATPKLTAFSPSAGLHQGPPTDASPCFLSTYFSDPGHRGITTR